MVNVKKTELSGIDILECSNEVLSELGDKELALRCASRARELSTPELRVIKEKTNEYWLSILREKNLIRANMIYGDYSAEKANQVDNDYAFRVKMRIYNCSLIRHSIVERVLSERIRSEP